MKTRQAKLFILASVAACGLMSLSSCATDKTPKPPHERISTIPQNQPESWEGGSPFGGFGQSR
ncbi:MAG: hypothetical protein GXP30_11450 [Verrucomicrobia bacterium]|nr:hypothetical protein [Verrucomicrobiota bacterium]